MSPRTCLHSNHWNVLGGQIVRNFGPATYHLHAAIAAMDAASSTVWRCMATVKKEVSNVCLFPLLFFHVTHMFSFFGAHPTHISRCTLNCTARQRILNACYMSPGEHGPINTVATAHCYRMLTMLCNYLSLHAPVRVFAR